jgi:hypothetical protein
MNDYGKTAYDGYCKSSGGKSLISGASLPEFDKLPVEIRQAWQAAAAAVVAEVRADV